MNKKLFFNILSVILLASTAAFCETKTVQANEDPGNMIPTDPAEEQYQANLAEPLDIRKPTNWLSWGFDFRAREVYQKNVILLNDKAPMNEKHFQRYRSRLFTTIKPTDWLEFNARLTWEFRHWCKPDEVDSNPPSEALFDNLNVKFIKPFGIPLTATLGRQDIFIGDGWLVADGTPLDGTRTMFFDAMRFQYELDKENNFDFIYIEQGAKANKYIKPFNYQPQLFLAEDDSTGLLFYWNNKSLIPRSELSLYFIYKDNHAVAATGDDSRIYTYGARSAGFIDKKEKLYYRAELAQQLGRKEGDAICALGFNSLVEYRFGDSWQNAVNFAYEYLSGDDPDTKANEQFDPLWGRWPRFSDLLTYTFIGETRFGEITNMHRLALGWNAKPCEKISLDGAYQLLFAAQNTMRGNSRFSNNGKFRGQLVQARMKYKFNENISGHLQGEVFFPGNYYSKQNNDPAVMIRYEFVFSW